MFFGGSAFSLPDRAVQRITWRRREILICTIVLTVGILRGGMQYSFGTFTVAIQQEFNQTMAEANWVGTIPVCLTQCLAPLFVAVIRFIGYRGYQVTGCLGVFFMVVALLVTSGVSSPSWMFLTYSIPFGVGAGLSFIGSSLIIGEYFDKTHKYHVFTTSLLLCGYTVGSLFFNPLMAWMLESFGWRLSIRINAAVFLLIGMPCSAFFVSRYSSDDRNISQPYDFNCRKEFCKKVSRDMKRRPEIPLWILGSFVNALCYMTPFLNLGSYMQDKGVAPVNSSIAVILLSLFEAVGYVVASLVGDKIKGRLVYVNIISSVGLTLICAIWPTVDVSYVQILAVSMAYGTCLGLSIVYSYAGSGEVTQLPLDVAWSYTNMSMGVAMLLGPFLSGLVYDHVGNYDGVFYASSVVYGSSVIIFVLIAVIRERWRLSKVPYEEMDDDPPISDESLDDVRDRKSVETKNTLYY